MEGERPVGFASYREIGNDELFGVLKDMELANLVRGKSSREILLITGIYAREENAGDSEVIRDAAQQLLVEVLAKELEKNYSFALFVAERGTTAKDVVYALERQGFIRPHLADESDKRTIYMVDMHEPLMFLHNLETTIKEPFASNPAVSGCNREEPQKTADRDDEAVSGKSRPFLIIRCHASPSCGPDYGAQRCAEGTAGSEKTRKEHVRPVR